MHKHAQQLCLVGVAFGLGGCPPAPGTLRPGPGPAVGPTLGESRWLLPSYVDVGTILKTDPTTWTGDVGFVEPANRYFEGKIPVRPPSGPGELHQSIDSKRAIDFALPFIKSWAPGGGFNATSSISIDATGTAYTEKDVRDEVQKVIGAADGKVPFVSKQVNDSGKAAAGDPRRAIYWLVTAVLRADSVTYKDQFGHTATAGLACPTLVVSIGGGKPATAPSSNSQAKPTSTAPSIGVTAKLSADLGSNKVEANALGGNSQPGTESTSQQKKPSTPAGDTSADNTAEAKDKCSLLNLNDGTTVKDSETLTKQVVNVTIKPLLTNGRGNVYLDDNAKGPKPPITLVAR